MKLSFEKEDVPELSGPGPSRNSALSSLFADSPAELKSSLGLLPEAAAATADDDDGGAGVEVLKEDEDAGLKECSLAVSPSFGTGGTSLLLESRLLSANDKAEPKEVVPVSVTVFFPSKAALAVTVTTDCNVDTFLRAIIAQALSPADQQGVTATLVAAEADGSVDEDCPGLDDTSLVNMVGIHHFLLVLEGDAKYETLKPSVSELCVGPKAKAPLADPTARLFHAAEMGHLEQVRHLIGASLVDVSATGIDRWTALHFAARQGHLAVVNYLLKNSANIDAVTKSGWSALHMACYQGHTDIADILITCGAQQDMQDKTGCTPRDYAEKNGLTEVLELLDEINEQQG